MMSNLRLLPPPPPWAQHFRSDDLDEVRSRGVQLADDELLTSDVVLPPQDATAKEVRALLNEDGLIPG